MEVVRHVVWDIVGGFIPITSELHWRPEDPAAVHAVFNDHKAGPTPWVFARATLTQAMSSGHGGAGDVVASRGGMVVKGGQPFLCEDRFGDKFWIYLSSPSGLCVLACQAQQIAVFLEQTFSQVPNGHEEECYLDGFDEEIEAVLGELQSERV